MSELTDGSYSVSDIQDYFECIIKKHETLKINHQSKCMSTKFRAELRSRLKPGTILNI